MKTVIAIRVIAILLYAALPALAQPASSLYPSKPVKLIVPFPPGGAVDYYARAVQPRLAENLGQTILIENRAGAGGMVGADAVAKSPPDGYTLLVGNIAALAMNVGIYSKMTYDPVKDLTPIVRTVAVNYVMAVHPSVPARSVAEFVAHARANPGKLSYGSAGSGSAPHLATELLKQRAGIDVLHVPFKGGGPMVTDLLGGQIEMVIADQANLMPHVKAGRLRALAVGTLERSSAHPELPTIAEAGFPGFEARAWQGIVGPAGMAPDIVKRLNTAFIRAMSAPEVQQRLLDGGLDPIVGTPEAFGEFIRAEIAKWSKVAKDVGARVE
ncbi:MAG TPA: tripartite tricarboxylate transporter substrate binding protein [Burkholderiales bacterium]|nr:tripartite tricarboxylate transporter substrate binding protein [Burkholderiales bacterium]